MTSGPSSTDRYCLRSPLGTIAPLAAAGSSPLCSNAAQLTGSFAASASKSRLSHLRRPRSIRMSLAMAFLKERGCIVPSVRRKHVAAGGDVHLDAMIELHARREEPAKA